MVSVEAQIEADEIGYQCHISSPLDNWAMYEVITDGLIAAKSEWRDALAVHDHARADRLLLEVTDLTALAAACAEGIVAQRCRFLGANEPWPLAVLS